jgi:hypothetical protein
MLGLPQDAGFRAVARKDGALDSILSTFPRMFQRGSWVRAGARRNHIRLERRFPLR